MAGGENRFGTDSIYLGRYIKSDVYSFVEPNNIPTWAHFINQNQISIAVNMLSHNLSKTTGELRFSVDGGELYHW